MAEGTLLALMSAMAFGLALVVTQRGLVYLSPSAGARISIPATTLLLWALAPWFFDGRVLDSPALWIFAAVGLFFPALVTLLTFEANRLMGPTIAGTLGSVAPLLAIAAAVLFLNETVTDRLLGAGLAVASGIALLSWSPRGSPRNWPRAALALPLSAAALRACAQALTKLGLRMVPSPYTAALAGYTISALAVWLLFRRRVPAAGPLSRRGAAWFVAAGLLNGSAVLAMYSALSQTKLTVVAPIVAAYPAFTILFSRALLGSERIGIRQVAGSALVVAGMVLILA